MATESLTDGLRDTLAVFEGPVVPLTTPEVADRLDLGRRSTYNRLERLVDHGRLETKKVGANARVWWRPRPTTSGTPDWPVAESLIDDVLDRAEVGVFVLDEHFDVAWINKATERYFGLDREHVIGRDKRHIVDEHIVSAVDDAGTFAETVLSTYDDNTYPEHFECHVTAGDDREERWLEHRSKPIESGAYAGGRVELYYDITDRKRAEGARNMERQEFESLVNAIEEYAIFTLDPDGHVRSWNPGAEAVKGYSPDDIVGEHFSTFYTDTDRDAGMPSENLAAAREEGRVEDEGWRVRADGSRFWANVTITTIRDVDGGLEGFAKVTRDMSERRKYEQELEGRYRTLVEHFPNGAVALVDEDLRYRTVGGDPLAAADATAEEIEGRPVREIVPPELADTLVPSYEAAFEGNASTFEAESNGRVYQFQIVPVRSGDGTISTAIGMSQDVTEHVETKRKLAESERRYRTLVERFPDGAVGLFGDDLTYDVVGGDLLDDLGYTPDDIVGSTFHGRYPDPVADRIEANFRAVFDGESNTFEFDFDDRNLSAQTIPVRDAEDEVGAGMLVVQDITERKQHERELSKYETLFQESKDVNVIVEPDGTFRYLTPSASSVFGYDPEELVGEVGFEFIHPDDREEALTEFEKMIETPGYEPQIEFRFEHKDGSWIVLEVLARDLRDDPDVEGVVIYTRDVTERKERERALEESERQYRTLVENFPNGAVILFDENLQYLIAGGEAYEGLDVSVEDLVGDTMSEHVPAELIDTFDPRFRAVFEGQASEFEFEFNDQIRQFQIVPVRDESGSVFAGLAISQDVTQHREHERALERQREQLAALNTLNEVVQDITDAVIEQSTREEIETALVEGLANADTFSFAWVGDVDTTSSTVELRAEAGVDGYLDGIEITVDPEDPRSEGPTGRALRTGDVQVTQDVVADDRHDPWRSHIEKYPFRSSAAVPIVHEGVTYGVLNVYADRPYAFEDAERQVLAQLGEVVGQAIAAVDRKRALTSDEITEIEFTVPDISEKTGIDMEIDGTITFDGAVPIGDGAYLEYGTVAVSAIDALEALVDQLAHFEAVTITDRGADTARFELQLSDPPVVSVVASRGGYLQQATIEEGDLHLSIHLPRTIDASRIVDAVHDAYPTADLVRRRQFTRSDDALTRVHRAVTEDLTDRQQATLEAAYRAGFFEWPKHATGEDVAESLGIAPTTFHQHLRKGQQQVFESVFSTPA